MKKITVSTLAGVICAVILAIPAAAAGKATAPSGRTAARNAWPAETLSGRITMVDPQRKLVVVQDPSGVPFDMLVTATTHIKSGDQRLTLRDLAQHQNKGVSVKFVPERRGDVAEAIRING